MWDLIVSVPDHCLSFYLTVFYAIQHQLEVHLVAGAQHK